MTNINFNRHVDELYERGFTLLPAFFNEDECRDMRSIMDAYWHGEGSPSLASTDFGYTIHPMMPKIPAMIPYLDRPEPIAIMAGALRDKVRLTHLGARISGPQSTSRIPWHNHYHWDATDLPRRDRIERLLAGVYVDGTLPEFGPLIACPRRYNDPLGEPAGDAFEAWPDEVKLEMPPGSIAIFYTALWHTAARGTGTGARRLWGGHYQGWSDPRPHLEDNQVDVPEIADLLNAHPNLKSLLAP